MIEFAGSPHAHEVYNNWMKYVAFNQRYNVLEHPSRHVVPVAAEHSCLVEHLNDMCSNA